jgi:hypothetical protein
MLKRTSKKGEDENTIAVQIVSQTTAGPPPKKKNPAAVALGHLGGLKGGKARAERLSAERRKEIAKKAAKIRWARLH